MFVHFISINHCLHVHLVVFLICDVYYEQWFTLQPLSHFFFFKTLRLLVSASQDGKLIVWDSYTTNKVSPAQQVNIHLKCTAITQEYNNCHKFND